MSTLFDFTCKIVYLQLARGCEIKRQLGSICQLFNSFRNQDDDGLESVPRNDVASQPRALSSWFFVQEVHRRQSSVQRSLQTIRATG